MMTSIFRQTRRRFFHRIFEVREQRWERYLDEDHRIDYVFLRKGSKDCASPGSSVFTEQDYGRVSDHLAI
jgi:maltose 6'-phosphate phosphatase